MDLRSDKAQDFVAFARNMIENEKKVKSIQLKWFRRYQWLFDENKNVKDELNKLFKESCVAASIAPAQVEDTRSCLPVPETTSGMYGWLAIKPEFRLEKYGSYIVNYPNPMDEVILLPGDIPTLAAGKGFLNAAGELFSRVVLTFL
ncbi:uncharacterized protein LOC107264743 [Cephus cinctus]|uniref:Uncharacterized protein LOC107264743 n=1 Tax=Cephus cinctus TaxID=211228 RepID=A0AAJ7BM10_CEPCN|nr:uncharacterized protein LOC107264743 [Cephus cinctus]